MSLAVEVRVGSSTQSRGWRRKPGSDREVLCRLVWDCSLSLEGRRQGAGRSEDLPDPSHPGPHPPHPLRRQQMTVPAGPLQASTLPARLLSHSLDFCMI